MADYLGKKIKFNIEDNDLQKIRFNKVYGESQQATRSGKNYFDASQIPSSTNIVVSDNGKTITMPIATSGVGYIATTKKLSELCPKLKVGDIATLRFSRNLGNTYNNFIYLGELSLIWEINTSKTITQEMLNNYVALYANRYDDGETGQCILTDFSIMLSSETDTSWEPYGASPSPDYRSKIENLEGKNKFSGFAKGKTLSPINGVEVDKETSAVSDYIAVDFNKNPNYYLSGLTNTLLSFVAAYNSNKKFLGRTGAMLVSYFSLNSSLFTLGTAQGTGDIAYLRVTTYENTVVGTTGTIDDIDNLETQLEEGTVATPYVPYNSLEFKDEGKNLYNVSDTNAMTEGITVDNEGWITVTGDNTNGTATKFFNYYTNNLNLKTGTNYNVIAEVKNVSGTGSVNFVSVNEAAKQFQSTFNKNFSVLANNTVYNSINKTMDEFVGNTGLRTYISFAVGQSGSITFRLSVLEDTTITAENFEYEEYKSQVATFPLAEGQKLYKGSYLADGGIHHKRKQVVLDGTETGWYTLANQTGTNTSYFTIPISDMKKASTLICDKFINRAVWNTDEEGIQSIIDNYIRLRINTSRASTVAELKTWLSNNPIIVEYELAEEEIVPYTETQKEAWEKLRHFKGLNGENNITAQGTMTSTLDLTLYNVAEEDFDIYISKKGYFGALKYDINNLIDFMESNIPSIAEATESSVKIAGRDGDISLNTVYEPLSFEIVCYTEDNLTPEEKIIEEQKITSLLNSIKNQTKTFFMEREKKFYKVKYSGNLSVVRYPKHLKFTIPLKSSESYAMNFEESEIIGNGTKVSNTIKDTGAIFTIKGPATKPIISLNNYQMKYNENILEGNSLIINSEDSTITHITSAGVKTNAMRAYNHEFPKIKNGENQLAVSSGIDDEKQVNVKWYDLKI